MASLNSFLSVPPSSSSSSSSIFLSHLCHHHHHPYPSISISFSPCHLSVTKLRKLPTLVLASSSSSSSSDDPVNNLEETRSSINPPKKPALSALIQDIEPFDITIIQKDVPPTTIDAMKRTISGMLGLLPSSQFRVHVEALWEPLSKLLISSMMTGYTLRNAEYRLCLERNLDMYEENSLDRIPDSSELDVPEILLDSAKKINFSGTKDFSKNHREELDKIDEKVVLRGLGEISQEAREYILRLQCRLSSAKRKLNEVKRQSAALQMQQFVGEEKNDLLDYLRSLQPEKVAELSEPASSELKETIQSVVHGLLATLSPRMHSKAPLLENTSQTLSNVGEDCPELVEYASPQFQPLVSLTRDFLARLLFWCMLLGHYLRGLEYRVELTGLLSLTANTEDDDAGKEQSA